MEPILSQFGPAVSGLERELEVITHNLANVSTVGYKRRVNSFSKILAAQGMGTETADAKVTSKTTFDFSQGGVMESTRSLDFALCGRGFFVVETPDGPLYTRNGMFRLNQDNQIIDLNGRTVAGESGPITIPASVGETGIHVSDDGNITAGGAAVGKFQLVDFGDDQDKLVSVGKSCFKAPKDVSPGEAENLLVKQGFQESSNVEMVEELTDMILVNRMYQANMQFVSVDRDSAKGLLSVAMG